MAAFSSVCVCVCFVGLVGVPASPHKLFQEYIVREQSLHTFHFECTYTAMLQCHAHCLGGERMTRVCILTNFVY